MIRGRSKIDYPATNSPTMLDIAWFAGIFEGEGHCRLDTANQFSLAVGQKEKWLLDRITKLFGGVIYNVKAKKNLKYNLPEYEGFYWIVKRERAIGLAYTIFSFLSPHKRAQIKKALGFEGDILDTPDLSWLFDIRKA